MRKMDCACKVSDVYSTLIHGRLQRTFLRDLSPELDNILIVGIIIAKQTPRRFVDKTKENESCRAVWNFTLRDSPRDYINVTYWACSKMIYAANNRFYIGDVVEIRHPRINIRKFNDMGEQFRPVVSSPYFLILNEHSEISHFEGDTLLFTRLLSIPTKPIAGFIPLRDIHNEGGNMTDRFIDILGAVRSVGTIRNITTKKGQETQLREMVLFDHTSPGLKITIWDIDVMTRAGFWKCRSTILFITDIRVKWSSFLRSYSGSLTNRSIVTENPIGDEARALAKYAKTAPLDTSAILNHLITTLPDSSSIQNVMCVQQVYNNVAILLHDGSAIDRPLTALMYVFISKLDLDGQSPTISVKCGHCKSWLRNNAIPCENPECSVVSNTVATNLDISFNIKVDLSDHTGTLKNCCLSGTTAEQVLECTVQQFMRMTDEQKCGLKWKFLLERYAVRIMALLLNRRTPFISIVNCSKADPIETAQRIPTY